MPTLSLVMIVKNEEKHLARCLNSIQGAVDEMIVVDTGSQDSTKHIARECGAQVFDFQWIDDFSAARNFGIEQATGDWIISLDADEYFELPARDSLQLLISNGDKIGQIKINSRFLRNGAEHTASVLVSRIFPRHVRYTGSIHEQLDSSLTRYDSGLSLTHDGYYETDKSDRNIRLLLNELAKTPDDPYLLVKLAKQYKGINQLPEAEQYYRKGYARMASRPDYAIDAIVDLLYVLLDQHKFQDAFAIIDQEFQQLSHVSDFHFVQALLYMEFALSNPDQAHIALSHLEQAYLNCLALGQRSECKEFVLGTSNFLAAYNLGVYYELTRQTEKAKSHYHLAASHGYLPAQNRLNNQ